MDRNIDELPKNVPRNVIDRLKSFPSLATNEDVESWHDFCRNIEYSAVSSM